MDPVTHGIAGALLGKAIFSKRQERVAIFAATLFLFHPIQTESVAWIAGRSESLSALFFLYAFVVFLYRPSGEIGWRLSLFIFLLATCAMASKEHTATLPIVLFLTDLWWGREDWVGALRRNWRGSRSVDYVVLCDLDL